MDALRLLGLSLTVTTAHRPLKIKTDGAHFLVHKLVSISIISFFTTTLYSVLKMYSVCYEILYTSWYVQHEQMVQICSLSISGVTMCCNAIRSNFQVLEFLTQNGGFPGGM